jgi:uncharacterized protein YbaP (TraB family)
MPHLWLIDRAPTIVRIFGGGPALAEPWSDPAIEALVAASDVFWCEVPKLEGDVQQLAIKYGVDPAAPLPTWLTPDDLARVDRAAATVGENPQILRAVRPWLAAQILKMAQETRAGLKGEYSAEQHLESVAERAGIRIRGEFTDGATVPAAEAVFAAFSAWPRQAEIERLLSVLDDIERGPASIIEQADAWRADDLALAEQIDQRYRRDYPALYETLVLARNRAWVDRIQQMLTEPGTAFILMGTGHLVGPASVLALLEQDGIDARPV